MGEMEELLERAHAILTKFVELEARTAKNSHETWVDGKTVWNGSVWRRADPVGYAMCAEGRRVLNALRALIKDQSNG